MTLRTQVKSLCKADRVHMLMRLPLAFGNCIALTSFSTRNFFYRPEGD